MGGSAGTTIGGAIVGGGFGGSGRNSPDFGGSTFPGAGFDGSGFTASGFAGAGLGGSGFAGSAFTDFSAGFFCSLEPNMSLTIPVVSDSRGWAGSYTSIGCGITIRPESEPQVTLASTWIGPVWPRC